MRLGLRKRHGFSRIVLLLCLFVFLFLILLSFVMRRAEPALKAHCSDYSNKAFTELVSKCISDTTESGDFNNLFEAVYDKNNRISSIEANSSRINSLKSALIVNIQNALNSDYPAYINIPIGALSKYPVLTSYGPMMRIKIIPISIVGCELDDEFESVGINQVRHKLYLDIYADMRYCGYAFDERERIKTSVPLAETIYSADVPVYYGGGMAGEITN